MLKQKTDKIRNAPRGFCLAKWYQVTVDLSRGYTHSCHHPERHKIPLEEVAKDPSALHNTYFKMLQRKMMLEGKRPPECEYCWKIEDMPGEHTSDRFIKSTDDWAYERFDETLNAPWDKKISPTYLEVVFSSECNLNCVYCMADVSSSIEREMIKFGPYPVISNQHRMGREPEIKGHNPYIEAFWKWFPEILPDLKIFRITGGEPLLSKHTFAVLDYLENNPAPNLELALNTNLSFSPTQLQKFLSHAKVLLAKKSIKTFTVFTSLDSFHEQASYIRKGLDLNKFIENISLISESLPESEIILMCTYNLLSIASFKKLLLWIEDLKKSKVKITLDISYLKDPEYLRANLANDALKKIANDDLIHMKENKVFSVYETSKYERIVHWINSTKEDEDVSLYRADFYSFISEFDRRFSMNFLSIFPSYISFFKACEKSNKWHKQLSIK